MPKAESLRKPSPDDAPNPKPQGNLGDHFPLAYELPSPGHPRRRLVQDTTDHRRAAPVSLSASARLGFSGEVVLGHGFLPGLGRQYPGGRLDVSAGATVGSKILVAAQPASTAEPDPCRFPG